jgi:hypothetical protein
MLTINRPIKRNVVLPSGKLERTANVTQPSVDGRDKDGNLLSPATQDSIFSFAAEVMATNPKEYSDPWQTIADLLQFAVDAKVQSKAYAKLGEVDAVSKMIAQTVKAMTPVLKAQGFDEADVRNMVLSLPQIKTAVESSKDISPSVAIDYSIADLFSDGRKKDEPAAEAESETETATA